MRKNLLKKLAIGMTAVMMMGSLASCGASDAGDGEKEAGAVEIAVESTLGQGTRIEIRF